MWLPVDLQELTARDDRLLARHRHDAQSRVPSREQDLPADEVGAATENDGAAGHCRGGNVDRNVDRTQRRFAKAARTVVAIGGYEDSSREPRHVRRGLRVHLLHDAELLGARFAIGVVQVQRIVERVEAALTRQQCAAIVVRRLAHRAVEGGRHRDAGSDDGGNHHGPCLLYTSDAADDM
eukprot:7072093-Prymnesium_polylepis.1